MARRAQWVKPDLGHEDQLKTLVVPAREASPREDDRGGLLHETGALAQQGPADGRQPLPLPARPADEPPERRLAVEGATGKPRPGDMAGALAPAPALVRLEVAASKLARWIEGRQSSPVATASSSARFAPWAECG
jgi:hypothetical protein